MNAEVKDLHTQIAERDQPLAVEIQKSSDQENVGKIRGRSGRARQGKDSVPAQVGTVITIESLANEVAENITKHFVDLAGITSRFIRAFYQADNEQFRSNIFQFQGACRTALYRKFGVNPLTANKKGKDRSDEERRLLAKVRVYLTTINGFLRAAAKDPERVVALLESKAAYSQKVNEVRKLNAPPTDAAATKVGRKVDWAKRSETIRQWLIDMPANDLIGAVAQIGAGLEVRGAGWETVSAAIGKSAGKVVKEMLASKPQGLGKELAQAAAKAA